MTEKTFAEKHGDLLTFLIRGDFARGQRQILEMEAYIGSFARGQRTLDALDITSGIK